MIATQSVGFLHKTAKMTTRAILLILFVSGLTQAQPAGGLQGVWVLDTSKRDADALPDAPVMMKVETTNDGIRVIELSAVTGGRQIVVVYYVLDCGNGHDCPASSGFTPRKPIVYWVRRIDQHPSARRRWAISADGLQLTIQRSTSRNVSKRLKTLTYRLADDLRSE